MPDATAPDILAILPLRAGSKGLLNKNLRQIAGKPLYRHALDQALRVVGGCVITTDIPEILETELPDGCRAIRRPPELAGDDTPMDRVLAHLFDALEHESGLPETAVLLQATSPLRSDDDIRAAIGLHAAGEYELVLSVTAADSGILKYGFLEDGAFRAVVTPEYCFANRQALPRIVRPNGAVFVFSPKVFQRHGGMATQSIGAIEMPEARSIDIDREGDLRAAEAILMHASATQRRETA